MTAIVANHECVVADARVSNGSVGFPSPKIVVVRGHILTGSGNQKPFELFCEQFRKHGLKPMPMLAPDARNENFDALVLAPTGRLFLYDADFAQLEITSDHFAIGCGAGAVLSVLAHIKRKGGKMDEPSLCDAVTAAADVVEGVGLPLQVVRLADIKPKRKKRA